jgi:tetratricopeptide (TPR) repeat protein
MKTKMDKTTVGLIAELATAKELVRHGFRIYFPHQAAAADDDLVAVNGDTGNVYRIQVKSKMGTALWSAIFFRNIKEKAHKSWFFILYEQPTERFYIVPSEQLAKLEADTKGFKDEEGKYLCKWDLLEQDMKKICFSITALLFFTAFSLYAQNAQTRLDNGKRLFDEANYDGAIRELSEAIRLDPNMAEAYAYRSWAYGRNNNNAQALTDANSAIQLNPRLAMGYYTRGNVYRNRNDYDRALADYTEAIRPDPRYTNAYHNRGFAYNAKGDYDRAIADYNEAISLDRRSAYAYNNRGNAYYNKGDYASAIADYEACLLFDPNNSYAREGLDAARRQLQQRRW